MKTVHLIGGRFDGREYEVADDCERVSVRYALHDEKRLRYAACHYELGFSNVNEGIRFYHQRDQIFYERSR